MEHLKRNLDASFPAGHFPPEKVQVVPWDLDD